MFNLFVERNLNRTVDFLQKIGLGEVVSVKYDPLELRAASLQNMSLFYDAYLSLLCPESKSRIDHVVFCSCCSSRRNFIRNNNLLYSGSVATPSVVVLTNRIDPFLNYLKAKLENDIELALSVIQDVPLFWDCYLLVIEITRNYIQIDSPLSSYFYLYLKLIKDIDHTSRDYNTFDLIDNFESPAGVISNQENIKRNSKSRKKNSEHLDSYESRAGIENNGNMHLRSMGRAADELLSKSMPNLGYRNTFLNNPGLGVAGEICFDVTNKSNNLSIDLKRDKKEENFTDLSMLPYDTSVLDLNSRAALHYCYGNQDQAIDLFSQINYITSFNISFFEFYGILLYNKNDSKIVSLADSIDSLFPESQVAHCLNALSYLYQGRFNDAKSSFRRYLKLDIAASTKDETRTYSTTNLTLFTADILCLSAFCYIKLTDYDAAGSLFQEALRNQPNNFRIHYSAAQGFFTMNRKEQSLWYCTKAIKIKDDASLFKLMGRIYLGLDEVEKAKSYFLLALENNEIDSNLYLADISRRTNNTEEALEYYKRYLDKETKNKAVVLKYLIDHYETTNDYESADKYRRMLSE